MSRALASSAAIVAAALALAACGSAPQTRTAPWLAAHPDPPGMHFADAEGLCAIAVQYPDDAPGEIDWKGEQYIQRSRVAGSRTGGTVVAHSGDWTVYQPSAGVLALDAGSATFEYRSGSKCGSNSAAPS